MNDLPAPSASPEAWRTYLSRHYGIANESTYIGYRGQINVRWTLDVCPWDERHTDRAARVVLHGDGTVTADCQHGCGEPRRKRDPREALPRRPGASPVRRPIHDSRSHRPRETVNDDGEAPLASDVTPLWGFERPAPIQQPLQGLLYNGYITILAADGGTGKSFLALYLSAAIALGEPFLGLPTDAERVLYVDYELSADEQKRRLARVLEGMGTSPGDARLRRRLFHTCPAHPIGTEKGRRHVAEIIDAHDIDLTILDSLSLALGFDATQQREITNVMQLVQRDWGTVLAIDHVPASSSGDASARPYGSVFKRNIARSTLTLSCPSDGTHLLVPDKNNFGAAPDRIAYQMDFDDDAETVTFTAVEVTDEAAAGALSDLSSREITLKAVEELHAEGGTSVTAEQVADWREARDEGIAAGTIGNHFTQLRKQGLIERAGSGEVAPASTDGSPQT